MLMLFVAVALGIIVADCFVIPLWCVTIGIVVMLLNAVMMPRGAVTPLCLLGSVMFISILLFNLGESVVPSGPRLYEIEIGRITSHNGSRSSGECRITDNNTMPYPAEARFTADSTLQLSAGDRLTAYCNLKPMNRQSENHYERYMSRRGMAGSVWLTAERVLSIDTLPAGVAPRLREFADQRIERLALGEDEQALVEAVTIGSTAALPSSLKESYRRSGASHLLAVSGLHVGFVCIVASSLLLLLLLLPHGQIVRSIAVIAFIWLYAAIVGFTPSIVRAALMFSLLQISLSFASRTISLNTLCFAAAVMLLWEPRQLWDAGFQLSCLAVAAIVEWEVPIIGWLTRRLCGVSGRHRASMLRASADFVCRWLISSVVVSIVASAATMPLAASLFGLSSLWAVVSGPIMVLLCSIVVGGAMVWILMPITILQPLFSAVVGFSAELMNDIATRCAAQPALIIEEHISATTCAAIYLIYILLTALAWGFRR